MADQTAETLKYITKKRLRQRWGDVSDMFVRRLAERDPRMPRLFHLPGSNIDLYDFPAIQAYERECIANPPPRGVPPARNGDKPPKQRRRA